MRLDIQIEEQPMTTSLLPNALCQSEWKFLSIAFADFCDSDRSLYTILQCIHLHLRLIIVLEQEPAKWQQWTELARNLMIHWLVVSNIREKKER